MASGFYWTANSPYVRGNWVRARRAPKTAGAMPLGTAMIGPDANPMHIIFECMTNADWGQGSSPLSINLPSFTAAAQTLFDEGFGISLLWTKQSKIEDFIGEVMDHAQGFLFLDPRTGLHTAKLLRNDYVVAELDVFNEDNASLVSFQRKSYAETVNEIVVTWTNPENEGEETITVQDLANIVMQGGEIISQPRNYHGIRNPTLATKVAARDLRSAAAPLATGQVQVNRVGWSKTPGDVIVINFPRRKAFNVVVRISEVDYGTASDSKVTVTFGEDIFGLEAGTYNVGPTTGWVDPSQPPAPMTFQRIMTVPQFLITNYAPAGSSAGDLEYPETVAGILASSNTPATVSYELVGNATLANGEVIATGMGTRSILGHATLGGALPAEPISTVPSFMAAYGSPPYIAGFVVIDGGSDAADEIALVQAIGVGGFTLYRGVMDTVPKPWPIGTPVWFINIEQSFIDETVRSAGETVSYRLLTRTDQGLLSYAAAPTLTGTLDARPHLPLRPANVTIGAQQFGLINFVGAGPYEITWSNRNRVTETGQIVPWSYSTVTPEAGQTTVILVKNEAGATVSTTEVAEGLSVFALPVNAFTGILAGTIHIYSKRDGLLSLQAHIFTFTHDGTPPPSLRVDSGTIRVDTTTITSDSG